MKFYMAICRDCGGEPEGAAIPFSGEAERDSWMTAHVEATGHQVDTEIRILGDVYGEWRVTAIDSDDRDYDFTWSLLRNPHLGEPEDAARKFIAVVGESGSLRNVRLMRRTVTIAPWEDVTDG